MFEPSLYTVFQRIFCRISVLEFFSGLCGALMIGCGLLGSMIFGVILDRTKRFQEFIKVSFCLTGVMTCIYVIVSVIDWNAKVGEAKNIFFSILGRLLCQPKCSNSDVSVPVWNVGIATLSNQPWTWRWMYISNSRSNFLWNHHIVWVCEYIEACKIFNLHFYSKFVIVTKNSINFVLINYNQAVIRFNL